ncbi:patatin-like phospholipase family protein [Pareuzebyella sediminis]|uniref:patatin-like phospholipase family protein n=1 Tax=Pareuzebyella sediminis TaxID=2607998 RepID=UPI0011EE2DA9|nr:patatin-like phospholipase family protein [Pareuzebyella sediminis]
MSIGIALSGGGARGAAHIGVLYALNQNGIYPDHISGSSAGSIIAALYCYGYCPKEILELSHEMSFLKIFKIGLLNKGLTELTYLRDFLKSHIDANGHRELLTKLHVCVSNINSGNFEIISSGDFIEPLLASCALPLLFKPVKMNGNIYVDGGLLNNLPVEPLLKVCDKIIGSSVSPHEEQMELKGMRNIGTRCLQLAIWNTVLPRLKHCNVALEIERSYSYRLFDLKKSDELFTIGYETTMARMPEIKRKLSG